MLGNYYNRLKLNKYNTIKSLAKITNKTGLSL